MVPFRILGRILILENPSANHFAEAVVARTKKYATDCGSVACR